MKWRQRKGKFAVVALFIFVVVIALLSVRSQSRAVRLTFLYATNHAQIGRVGVFELVNCLNEPVSTSGGHYKPAKQIGMDPQKGAWGAPLSPTLFNAGTTNTLEVWMPTNGGPYRLVLQCLPRSKGTPQFYRSARFRIINFIASRLRPDFVTQARCFGSTFVESQSFGVTQ